MIGKTRLYSFRVDGHEILRKRLRPEYYMTQPGRDKIRQEIAKDYAIPRHYLRMVDISHGHKIKYSVRLRRNIKICEKEPIK